MAEEPLFPDFILDKMNSFRSIIEHGEHMHLINDSDYILAIAEIKKELSKAIQSMIGAEDSYPSSTSSTSYPLYKIKSDIMKFILEGIKPNAINELYSKIKSITALDGSNQVQLRNITKNYGHQVFSTTKSSLQFLPQRKIGTIVPLGEIGIKIEEEILKKMTELFTLDNLSKQESMSNLIRSIESCFDRDISEIIAAYEAILIETGEATIGLLKRLFTTSLQITKNQLYFAKLYQTILYLLFIINISLQKYVIENTNLKDAEEMYKSGDKSGGGLPNRVSRRRTRRKASKKSRRRTRRKASKKSRRRSRKVSRRRSRKKASKKSRRRSRKKASKKNRPRSRKVSRRRSRKKVSKKSRRRSRKKASKKSRRRRSRK
tara:strand:- start:1675 stop:2802 length:1128 start_codon:yes stop_codon:yes gene_type:complete